MATVTWLREKSEDAGTTLDGLQRQYTRNFDMLLSGPATEDEARTHFIAQGYGLGAIHPNNVRAVLVGSSVVFKGGVRHVFECRAFYRTVLTARLKADIEAEETPASRTPVISYSFSQHSKFVEKDVNGNALRNSALVPFDPQETFVADPVAHVSWYLASTGTGRFNFVDVLAVVNHVNSDDWHGLDPKQALCVTITAEPVFEQNARWWKMYAEVVMREETWQLELLDAGLVERGGPTGLSLLNIKDVNDDDIREPVALDGTGHVLGFAGTPVFLPPFDMYLSASFKGVIPNFNINGEYVPPA